MTDEYGNNGQCREEMNNSRGLKNIIQDRRRNPSGTPSRTQSTQAELGAPVSRYSLTQLAVTASSAAALARHRKFRTRARGRRQCIFPLVLVAFETIFVIFLPSPLRTKPKVGICLFARVFLFISHLALIYRRRIRSLCCVSFRLI